MNWVFLLLPVLLDFIKKLQKSEAKLSKAKVKKAILTALASGEIKLPKEIPLELVKLLLPTILDILWSLMDSTKEIQAKYLITKKGGK